MQFIHNLLPTLQYYIENYGSLGVFLASIIEELFPPIPSVLVQGLGGLLIMADTPFTLESFFQLLILVSIPASIGVCIGSLPFVYLAQKYGIVIIEKYGKYLGTNVSDLQKLEERLSKSNSDEYIFILARAFPAIPSIVLAIYSGIVGMSLGKYFFLSFIGVMIRTTLIGLGGWILGRQFLGDIAGMVETIEKIVILIIIGVIVYLFYKNYLKKH